MVQCLGSIETSLLFCEIPRGCRVLLHHFVRVQLVNKSRPLKRPNDHEGDNKSQPPVDILNQINPFDNLLPKSFRSILILSYHPFFHIAYFSSVQIKICKQFYSLQCVLHSPPVSITVLELIIVISC